VVSSVTQSVKQGTEDGAPFSVDGAAWIRVVPVRTPTLPPATRTNCYIVGDRARALAIDPATPYADEQARLDAYVESEGIRLAAIVLTHHHVDHVGDAARLAAKHGVPVWAHRETASRVAGRVQVSAVLDEGARVDVGASELRALFTPGHAPGHLCFVDTAYSCKAPPTNLAACATDADCATVELGCYCGPQPVHGVAVKYAQSAQSCEDAAGSACALGCLNELALQTQDGKKAALGTPVSVRCDRSVASGTCTSYLP